MSSDGAGWVAQGNTFLQVSGEIRYLIFINLGNATADVKIQGVYSLAINVMPANNFIQNGAFATFSLGNQEASLSLIKSRNQTVFTSNLGGTPNPPPATLAHTLIGATGRIQIGRMEPIVGYLDYGANQGFASSTVIVVFSVSDP